MRRSRWDTLVLYHCGSSGWARSYSALRSRVRLRRRFRSGLSSDGLRHTASRITIRGSTMSRSTRAIRAFNTSWRTIRISPGRSHAIRACSTMPPGARTTPPWRTTSPPIHTYGRRLTTQTGPLVRPKPDGVTTTISVSGAMPIGGIKTIPVGFTTITRTGPRSTPDGSFRMAPTTSSVGGITANGGTTRIRVG